jgi:hypothetical protein
MYGQPDPPPEPRPAWEIVRTEDAPIVGGPNISTRGKRIWYRDNLYNSSSYVEVPLSEYNASHVAELIDAAVTQEFQVRALQGAHLPP